MSRESLSEDVERFIAQHIDSVEKLEILLLLARNPQKSWSPREVFQQIQSSIPSVGKRLAELERAALVKADAEGNYQFRPGSEEGAAGVRRLIEAYEERRIKVIEVIYSPRKDELQLFSDVFRMRKDNE